MSTIERKRKFYLSPSKDAPVEDLDFDYAWDNTAGAVRHGTTWDSPSGASFSQLAQTENTPTFILRSGHLTYRTLFFQFVSDSLEQTLNLLAATGYPYGGPMLRGQRTQPAPAVTYPVVYRACTIRVLKPDKSVRMVLGAMSALGGMLSRTQLQALGFTTGTAGTLYDAEPGDMIVTEIGIQAYVQLQSQSKLYAANLEVGDGSLVDLTAGDTDQHNSWSGIHWTETLVPALGGPTIKIIRALSPTRRALHQQSPTTEPEGGFFGELV